MLWGALLFLLILWVLKFGFGVDSIIITLAMAFSWFGFVLSLLLSKKTGDEQDTAPQE